MVKFDFCDAQFRDIHFDGDDYLTEDELFELYDMIPVTDSLPLFEVNAVVDEYEIQLYIYIKNDDADELCDETVKFLDALSEFDAYPSDEDYDCDVVIVNFTHDELSDCRTAIYERSLRVCPKCGERKAQPNFSKWVGDRELFKYYCTNCNYSYVGLGNGKFIREGELYSDYEMQLMWERCH